MMLIRLLFILFSMGFLLLLVIVLTGGLTVTGAFHFFCSGMDLHSVVPQL